MKLNVFNYTGQLVIQAQDIPVGKSMIELSNQPEGVYILQLVGTKQIITDRIVLKLKINIHLVINAHPSGGEAQEKILEDLRTRNDSHQPYLLCPDCGES